MFNSTTEILHFILDCCDSSPRFYVRMIKYSNFEVNLIGKRNTPILVHRDTSIFKQPAKSERTSNKKGSTEQDTIYFSLFKGLETECWRNSWQNGLAVLCFTRLFLHDYFYHFKSGKKVQICP